MKRDIYEGVRDLKAGQTFSGAASGTGVKNNDWALRTDGAGVDLAALKTPVTHYQGFGELKR